MHRDSEAGEKGNKKFDCGDFYNLPILVYNRSHKRRQERETTEKGTKGTKGEKEKKNRTRNGWG